MELDRGHIYDGFVTLERGIDSGRTAASLPRNQASFAINTTFRGGEPKCRPGWIKRRLLFKQSDGTLDTTTLAAFTDGRFQGATAYNGASSCLLAAVSGHLYRIRPDQSFRVTDVSPTAPGSTTLTKWWFCQAEDFMVCQDGQMKPIVYDGASRRLTGDDELPPGQAMAYAGGRIWVTLPNGNTFIAGDLAYSSSGTPEYGYRDSVLKITENDYLTGGGYFTVPIQNGGIRAMIPTSNLDTSLGQGPLLVMTPRLVLSVNAPYDRTTWQNLNYPIATVALDGYGSLSDRSTVTVNGDIFYRSDDGIRSFKLARRDFDQWGNTPTSAEMNRILVNDSRNMLEFSSAVVFDNRVLSTVSPFWVQGHGVPHRGLAVLDLDILSRMSGAMPPAWEGLWTGLNILQLVVGWFDGEQRCFAFALNSANGIELWELSRDYPFDNGDGGDSPIEWSVEFKALDFNSPFGLKQLEYGELWIDSLTGKVTISAEYRPDQYPKWLTWHSGWSEEATCICDINDLIGGQAEPRKQYRSKMKLPSLDYSADSIEDRSFRNFFTIQPRVQLVGSCRLKQVRVVARPVQEANFGQYRT